MVEADGKLTGALVSCGEELMICGLSERVILASQMPLKGLLLCATAMCGNHPVESRSQPRRPSEPQALPALFLERVW